MNKREIRRRVFDATMAAFGAIGVLVTIFCFDSLIDLPPIEWRWIILPVSGLILFVVSLCVRLEFTKKAVRNASEYNIENYQPTESAEYIYTGFINDAQIDHYVTICAEVSSRERVIGYGKVSNIKSDEYIEIEICLKIAEYDGVWKLISENNKAALLSTHILLSIDCKVAELRKGEK